MMRLTFQEQQRTQCFIALSGYGLIHIVSSLCVALCLEQKKKLTKSPNMGPEPMTVRLKV